MSGVSGKRGPIEPFNPIFVPKKNLSSVGNDAYIYTEKEIDCRKTSKKIKSFIISVIHAIGFQLGVKKYMRKHGVSDFDQIDMKPGIKDPYHSKQWKPKTEGLFVMMHGLMGHPSIWHNQITKLKETMPNCERFVPFVSKQGNCGLEEAGRPILNKIVEYTKANPGKPICLLGVSNGATLCHYIETELRKEVPGASVMVSSVAGVHYGSKKIDLANRIRLHNPAIRKRLAFASAEAKKLLDAVKQPLGEGKRKFVYFASLADSLATHVGTALPRIGHADTSHYVVDEEGHSSIVKRVMDAQLEQCSGWLKEHNLALKMENLHEKISTLKDEKKRTAAVQDGVNIPKAKRILAEERKALKQNNIPVERKKIEAKISGLMKVVNLPMKMRSLQKEIGKLEEEQEKIKAKVSSELDKVKIALESKKEALTQPQYDAAKRLLETEVDDLTKQVEFLSEVLKKHAN